jgi:GT2 family glycosyltransferase
MSNTKSKISNIKYQISNNLDLSIVIVNFNTKQITLDCLDSIYKIISGLSFEVVVVDNGSTDDSAEALSKLESKYKNFKLIRSSVNLGFGAGNNLGVKAAKGEYLLLLNTDTIFTENNLSYCVEAVRKNKQIGAYSCNLVNKDGSHQPSGGHFPTLFRLLTWQFFIDDLPLIGDKFTSIHPHSPGFFFMNKLTGKKGVAGPSPTFQTQPDWVTGAFMLVPRKVFWQAGGFDENIFMYTEELELCYRIKKLGKKIVLDGHSSVTHLGGASGGSYLAITKEVEGMLYFWKKHKSSWQLPLVKSIFGVGSLLRLVIFGIIGNNATARKSYWQALRQLA